MTDEKSSTKALRELCDAATPGPWIGVIKPNGKGTGLVGAKAKRGMGEQGCIAVVNSIPGGAERTANTKLIAAAVNALPALLDVAEAAQAVALKPYGNWKDDGCDCSACARRRLGLALARLNPRSTSAGSAPCGLCGRDPAAGTAGAWNDGVETRLCHGDGDPVPTCYSRWLHGERPVNRQLLPQKSETAPRSTTPERSRSEFHRQ